MRIVQITDLHIGHAQDFPFEIDVRANFLKILAAVKAVPHDLLIISGDLCYQDGEKEIYHWIKMQLDEQEFNYLVTPGNHDDTALMVEAFGLQDQLRQGELFTTSTAEQAPFVMINSGTGKLTATCLDLLTNYLAQQNGPVCLFMHHPPTKMGTPYMDNNHAFQDEAALLRILTAHPYPISIFTGHYHIEKSVRFKNLDIHVTPSCFFQINWREQEFAVDHHRIAYRYLDWDGIALAHSVVYVD